MAVARSYVLSSKAFLVGCVFVGLVSFKLNAAYTFTSIDGRTLEAEIIEASDFTVTIRRSSDGRRFTMDIDRLIPEDAVFIQAWLRREQTEAEPLSKTGNIGKWPRKLKPDNYDITIVREDNETGTYIYRTPHFEFHSTVKFARRVVREFSQIFESTLLAVSELPLKLNPGIPENTFFLTQIFETEGQYVAAGGIPNSAGVYFPESRKIMVPLRHLGVKKTSSAYTIDESEEINVLAHEITHQVTHDWLDKLPIWASEGIAEYIEHVPYERGAFRFDRFEVDEVFRRGSPSLRKLEVLMNMSLIEWNQALAKGTRRVSSNYLSALVLYYYFCHFDLDEAGNPKLLYDYLRAIEAGESQAAATKILLNGRSYEELEEAVVKAYRREDIKLAFL